MTSLDDYRIRLKEIADFAFSHGANFLGEKIRELPTLPSETQMEFVMKCHEGYGIAQNLIVKEIIYYQNELERVKAQEKIFLKQRNKIEAQSCRKVLAIIQRRLNNFSHIADGIAWLMIGGQIHVARRFYLGENANKNLLNSNIENTVKIANEINQDLKQFALISDLTNIIQIGDLLNLTPKGVIVIELKEGAANKKVNDYLANLKANNQKVQDQNLDELFDKNTSKQIKRVDRQNQRMTNLVEIVNNDSGIDPRTGQNITISTPEHDTVYYLDEMEKLYKQMTINGYSYGLIEGCVHIGMYSESHLLMYPSIKFNLENTTENFTFTDWMSIAGNVSEPIFSKPFPPDFIIDVLVGKTKVMIGIDFDKLIVLFNQSGIKTYWLTKKKTAQFRQQKKNSHIPSINGRAIEMHFSDDYQAVMSGGVISKIIYDNILPSSIARAFLSKAK